MVPNNIKFEIKGLPEVTRVLRKLPARLAKKVFRKATAAAAKPIRKDMRSLYRQNANDTGNLRRSVGIRIKTYRRTGDVIAVIGARKAPKFTIGGQTAAKYAVGIERGWRNRTPKPVVRIALVRGKSRFVEDFVSALGNNVAREAVKDVDVRKALSVK